MKILIINGSPKGEESITLQTIKYLEILFKEHEFKYLNVGQKIRLYEKDFIEPKNLISWSDLIIFSYPVYIFLAPYQLQRFIELLKENNVSLLNKNVTQVTTSKHFYDVSAHKFIFENMKDMNARIYRGLSADMDDLLTNKGQQEAKDFFKQLMFDIENENYDKTLIPFRPDIKVYNSNSKPITKTIKKTAIMVSCYSKFDHNIQEMIKEYKAKAPYEVIEYNIYDYQFQGGCLGCFSCAVSGHCIYKDGFEDFLRNNIQKQADAIIYAFPIINHYSHAALKEFDDRQFCNGHRMVVNGTPVSYLLSGNYSYENNLSMIIEARSEVGGQYLTGVVSDEADVSKNIDILIKNTTFAMENKLSRPKNFYGDGGNRIFRDLIYVMRGLMKADHKFYKKTGVYNTLPQKQKARIFQMEMVGLLMKSKKVQMKMKGKMGKYIIAPYEKILLKAKEKQDE